MNETLKDQLSDTDQTYTNIRIHRNEQALPRLRILITASTEMYGWNYLTEPDFLKGLLNQATNPKSIWIIADARQRPAMKELRTLGPRIHAATWATNRTMHDKTWIFPSLGTIWIGTQNMTRGSWSLSRNTAVEIWNHNVTHKMWALWQADWKHAKKL